MSLSSERVKKWRRESKSVIVEGFGGKCAICSYNKCHDAFDLHHLDPSKKNFGIAGIRANPKKWELIKKELENCILLCSNCHREFHAGLIKIPKKFPKFVGDRFKQKKETYCPICNKLKPNYLITCSKSCAAKKAQKVDWEKYDLKDLYLNKKLTNVQIADIFECSDVAVVKRLKKMKLYKHKMPSSSVVERSAVKGSLQ